MRNNEFQIQVALVNWLKHQYPDVLYCASAGGLRTSKAQAGKMKAAGYIAGCPDLMIFHPAKGYHGLFIELKAEEGKASPAQKEFLNRLNDAGYYAVVCNGFDEAFSKIVDYMKK